MNFNLLNFLFNYFGIKKSPNLPRVFNNTLWLFIDNAIRFIIGLWVVSWLARYLRPNDFGLFNYVLAFVSLFSWFANLGLSDMLVRLILTHPAQKENILTTAFYLRCAAGAIAFITCLILAIFINPSDHQIIWLSSIIAFSLLFQAFDVLDSYFQSQLQSKYTVFAKNSSFIIMSLIKIYLILNKAPLVAFAWATLAEGLLGACGLACIYQSLGFTLFTKKFDQIVAKILIQSCWPICCAGVVVMLNMRIDQIFLLLLKGKHEVGIYSSAVKVSETWYILGAIIVTSTFPVIIQFKDNHRELYKQKVAQLYKILYFLGGVVSILTAILAKPIIGFLYGPDYREAAPVLAIHVFSVTFVFMMAATTYAIIADNLQPYHLFRVLLGCILNIILNLLFIPRWGAVGAAAALIISCIVSVYSILLFKKVRIIF